MKQSKAVPLHPGQYTSGQLFWRLLGLAWRFKGDCLLSLVLSGLLLLLAVVGLQWLGVAVDVIRHALDPSVKAPTFPFGLSPPPGWLPLRVVTWLSIGIMAQAVLRALLTYYYSIVTARLTQGKIVPELRDRLYDRLQHLSFGFFDAHGSSSIFNRVTGDVQSTRMFVDGVVLQGLNMLLTLGTYFVCMWSIHPRLTLACLCTTIGIAWVTKYYSGRLRPGYMRNRELYDQLVLIFTECVRGMQTVKGFAAEAEQMRRFREANRQVKEQQRRIFWDLSIFTPATQFLSHASLVILFGYGGLLYVQGEIPLGGGLVVFAGLLQQFNGQVANVTTIANSVQQSVTGARRVFEVLDAPNAVESAPDALPPGKLSGRICFEDVTFGYPGQEPVLKNVSFETLPGQIVGIFGATGVGKSSLLSLIPRFYDPLSGRILADGKDIRKLVLDSYRKQIGIVYQESFLFSNTVAANIAFGSPHASQEEIERAAKVARAHDFIMQLSDGYETVLGESGVDLSGGQRQRIALARALLTRPPILILDDPTASVDARTEGEILEALRGAVEGRTAFVAANRLNLLRKTNVVLVLQNGRLVDQGAHEELMARPGPYRDAAEIQLLENLEQRASLESACEEVTK